MTFSTYGTHLPGSEKGWIDKQHASYGGPAIPPNSRRQAHWQSRLNETPWTMNAEARDIVLQAIQSVCVYRNWISHAFHIRTTHVHAVVSGDITPERMLSDFKAYATRALRLRDVDGSRRRYWGSHGSTRYLWNEISVRAAIEYVLNGQGERMALFPDVEKAELGR